MSDAGLVEERAAVEPVAVGPGDPASNGRAEAGAETQPVTDRPDTPPTDGAVANPQPALALSTADASLLALIDRLSGVLERADLGELEVSSGDTTIVLRAPSAIAPPVATAAAPQAETPGGVPPVPDGAAPAPAAAPVVARPAVTAPLTGIYYGAPSPGATPYVAVGDHVSVGQIIGLIEAMKLFNEIKSDLAGRVARICVDSGALVKAKQPLIEVEPA
ncbi:MAG TPA: biotin/lipoyl-containing protein [Candidatus Limnocylindrales bacterium]